MDTRRRPTADAASWRNVVYTTGSDVVDPVFNRVRLVLLVCPLSAVAVRFAVRESVTMSVRLDPQQNRPSTVHTSTSLFCGTLVLHLTILVREHLVSVGVGG